MPSYKNLAIAALAASSVSPALSAPIGSSQKQSRAEVAAHPLFLMPYPNVMVPGAVPPAPGGSSKRATDAPESRAIAELEGRGVVLPKPVILSLTQKIGGSGLSAGKTAALAGGAAVLAGGAAAIGTHVYDQAHPAPPPGESNQAVPQIPSGPPGGNSKRGNAVLLAPLPSNELSQRDVPSPEVVAVLNALNQRADVPSPEVIAVLNAVPPAPGGSSKRAADAPESRAIAELEGRGAVLPKPVIVSLTQKVVGPGLSAGKTAALVGGAVTLGGGLAAYGTHEYDQAHSGGNSKRDVPPEVVAVLNALNQRADYTPEDGVLRLLVRALNELD